MPTKLPEGWSVSVSPLDDEEGLLPGWRFAILDAPDKDTGRSDLVARLDIVYFSDDSKRFVVKMSRGQNGYGAYLYDYAMRWVSKKGGTLESDLLSVSDDAARVWDAFMRKALSKEETEPKIRFWPRPDRPFKSMTSAPRPEESLHYRYWMEL